MLSYQNIYALPKAGVPVGDFHRFRRVEREGFNVTDVNDTRFFKLFFYFYNEDNSQTFSSVNFFNGGSSGLLAPTWLDDTTITEGDYYKYNSAWAYLKNNYEDERAKTLENFIELLSEISSNSPWYFQKVTGVDEALVREKWQVNEERKKISIECLADPVDRRIESLLSMYRSIVWSHQHKCEVLPANLRKFDMGLFVFSGLVEYLDVNRDNHIYNVSGQKVMTSGTEAQNNWAPMGHVGNPERTLATDRAAYKYIEFHNCEISMDSIKSGYGDLNNVEGFEQTFTIDIYFDDCYENEFNPFLMQSFGDFFIWDAWTIAGYDENDTATGDIPKDKINAVSGKNDDYIQSTTILRDDMNDRLYHETPKPTFASITSNVLNEAVNLAALAVGGGLGNIYGQGYGVQGALDATFEEVEKQAKTLQNKISGNIRDSVIGASRNVNGAVTKPLLGTIKKEGSAVADALDAAHEDTGEKITDLGNMVENGMKSMIGENLYGNQIGMNRLNVAKLGNMYHETII